MLSFFDQPTDWQTDDWLTWLLAHRVIFPWQSPQVVFFNFFYTSGGILNICIGILYESKGSRQIFIATFPDQVAMEMILIGTAISLAGFVSPRRCFCDFVRIKFKHACMHKTVARFGDRATLQHQKAKTQRLHRTGKHSSKLEKHLNSHYIITTSSSWHHQHNIITHFLKLAAKPTNTFNLSFLVYFFWEGMMKHRL